MDSGLERISHLYKVASYLYPAALEGLSRDELLRSPDSANPMIWLAGHLAYCRAGIVGLAGGSLELPWPALFGRYSKPADDPSVYPELEEIMSVWRQATEQMKSRFEMLTEADLLKPAALDNPTADKTVRGSMLFLAWHEAYHLGQMAYLRKWLGRPGLIDG